MVKFFSALKQIIRSSCVGFSVFLFAFPASTNYSLRDFGLGAGGSVDGASSNYRAETMVGEEGIRIITINFRLSFRPETIRPMPNLPLR